MISEKEISEIKIQLREIQKLLEEIHRQLVPSTPLSPAKIYQLKEKARKKALEISQKLNTE